MSNITINFSVKTGIKIRKALQKIGFSIQKSCHLFGGLYIDYDFIHSHEISLEYYQ